MLIDIPVCMTFVCIYGLLLLEFFFLYCRIVCNMLVSSLFSAVTTEIAYSPNRREIMQRHWLVFMPASHAALVSEKAVWAPVSLNWFFTRHFQSEKAISTRVNIGESAGRKRSVSVPSDTSVAWCNVDDENTRSL